MDELGDALRAGEDDDDPTTDLLTEKPSNIVISSQDLQEQVIYIRKDIFDKMQGIADGALKIAEDYGDQDFDAVLDELREGFDAAIAETGL